MIIYQHRATVVASSGSTSSVTLRVMGGICRHALVLPNTATTVFRANLVDSNDLTVLNWGFHRGELNDQTIQLPMAGSYTVNVTNASPDDTFRVLLSVEE